MPDPEQREPERQAAAAGTMVELDLPAEVERLKAEPAWSTGRSARTLLKHDDLRIVLTAMAAGARIAEHKAPGPISVHVLAGHVRMRAAGRTVELRRGGLLALDRGVPHDVEAIDESAFLLTLSGPGGR